MTVEPVVVTGVGAVTPLGVGARTMYQRWCEGSCGIEDGEGACRDFDPLDFLTAKDARRADRFTQLALAAAVEALADAGWDHELPAPAERVGCVLGIGIGGLATMADGQDAVRERGEGAVSPLAVPRMMSNAAPAWISMRFGLEGPTQSVGTACASGANALGCALRMLQVGEVDAVVAGGSEATLTPLARGAFGALDALSTSGISRPFDARRDGFVLGEGAGILVLERQDAARERGARCYGTVKGYGASSDAHHLTAPREDGVGQATAIRAAMHDAGIAPADVDYINAHGTSTPLNDRAETNAIKVALGPRAASVPVSSLKSATGHLLGAAGAVEAIATLLALDDRVAPPTLGLDEPDEGLDLDYVPFRARALGGDETERAVGLSNSFGFGGHNAVVCLEAP